MPTQTTTFKGARYIVKFHDPIQWNANTAYEAIEAVQNNGFTYISKQPVPVGVQISNTDFWLLWADPNAQMEQLRELVEEYADNVEELSGVVSEWNTELGNETTARENADTAISQTVENLDRRLTGTPFGMRVDDWVKRFTIEPIGGSGYMNSMAYDSYSDTLYICFFMGGTTCIIRKYPNVSSVAIGGLLNFTDQLTITNNHCNSCSIANDKLYCSSWNEEYISVIDLSDFTFAYNITVGYKIRECAVYSNIILVQPYNANYMVKYYMNTNHVDDLDYAMSIKIPLAAQREYVEDCHLTSGYLYRVCSMNDNNISNPYIEIYPNCFSTTPIIVPIDFYIDGEWQGITDFNNGMLIGYDDGIYFSQELPSCVPQIQGNHAFSNLWRDSTYQMLNSATVNNSGLPYTYDDTAKTFTIEFPSGFIAGCKSANALIPLLSFSIRMKVGTAPHGIFNHIIDLTNLTTTQHSQFTLISNSGSGFYMYTMYADLNNDTLVIKINDCYQYDISGQTLTKLTIADVHADVYGGFFKLVI